MALVAFRRAIARLASRRGRLSKISDVASRRAIAMVASKNMSYGSIRNSDGYGYMQGLREEETDEFDHAVACDVSQVPLREIIPSNHAQGSSSGGDKSAVRRPTTAPVRRSETPGKLPGWIAAVADVDGNRGGFAPLKRLPLE